MMISLCAMTAISQYNFHPPALKNAVYPNVVVYELFSPVRMLLRVLVSALTIHS